MPRQNSMGKIERQKRKPIRTVLIELYNEFGNQKQVAKQLGVSQPTLSTWLAILGLKQKTIIVPREQTTIEECHLMSTTTRD